MGKKGGSDVNSGGDNMLTFLSRFLRGLKFITVVFLISSCHDGRASNQEKKER